MKKNLDAAPTLPDGTKAMTFPEMYDELLGHFGRTFPDESAEVIKQRAWAGVSHLIDTGLVGWWGMSAEGLPTYVPVSQSTHVLMLVRRDK